LSGPSDQIQQALGRTGDGSRSQFETEVRWANPTKSAAFSPLQNSYGTITPSGLHYERHHGGIPSIDPAKHRLVIHGLVDRPIKYSLADLKRFPTLSRTYFMECSGTTGSEIMKARETKYPKYGLSMPLCAGRREDGTRGSLRRICRVDIPARFNSASTGKSCRARSSAGRARARESGALARFRDVFPSAGV
jgi:hypothetical protein